MTSLLAIAAGLALAALDYLIVSAAFLDVPKLGEGLLALAAIGVIAAWVLRRSLPLFVTQNLLLAVAVGHALEAGSPFDVRAVVTITMSFLLANGLAWLVARGLLLRRSRTADIV